MAPEQPSVTRTPSPRTSTGTTPKVPTGNTRPALTRITNLSSASLQTTPPTDGGNSSDPKLPSPSKLPASPQSLTVHSIELEYDPRPGPFVRTRHVKDDGYGEIVAARELDISWVRGKSCGRILALKVFEKKVILDKKLEQIVMNELRAYQTLALKHGTVGMAYVTCLGASFEAHDHILFASDFMQRNLSAVLRGNACEREEYKKQWIAQIALGLFAIHKAGLIHRDLKPEHVLLDTHNNIRISGFANAFVNRWSTALAVREGCSTKVCGTWPYIAPEMLKNAGKPLEKQQPLFKTLGDVTLYDLYGPGGDSYPPFAGMSEDAESLIFGLACVDVATRLGDRELRRHPYFNSASGANEFKKWNKFRGKLPRMQSDIRWIEADYDTTKGPIVYRPVDPSSTANPPPGEARFAQFRWTHPKGVWAAAGVGKHILYRS